eukprot:GEMP01121974.1.p1 GENE.GEMP01121974.1~~GEMP01121974.1.p1  ORF type:complete len:102 (+),score=18.53 GEMP01121974.1:32-307(+)
MPTYRVFVEGTVQGVFFRKKTHRHATRMGLRGTVRNMADGRVEIVLTGPDQQGLDALLNAMKNEPRPVHVTNIVIETLPEERQFSKFDVLH